MASPAVAISMEEYQRTSFEWDAEWVDGEVIHRPLPNVDHANALAAIGAAFSASVKTSRLYPAPQSRIRVAPRKWRIPDLAIFADEKAAEGVIPFGAVEILSPDDSMSTYIDKFDEFAAAGVESIWLVDPAHGRIQRYQNGSLLHVDAIEFPDRSFRLTAAEIFA